jgi:hypothetical protein
MTHFHVKYSQCWHSTYKACVSIMHQFVDLNTCNHTIISKVSPLQLQDMCQTRTLGIKTGFTDVCLESMYVYSEACLV